MLTEKQIAIETHKQKSKFVTVIHPEKLTTTQTTEENNDNTFLISWLFLIGSLIFLLDGFIELSEDFSIHVLLHITASTVFTIASGQSIETEGRQTDLWEKHNGKWAIVHEHTSAPVSL
ncbi:MAG: hypothetical protein QNJ49_00375 [Mastigocoleus sp. MO_167.B18]|nr:hypothetical protein [Mastigocoleus sp. MO_167.B18]